MTPAAKTAPAADFDIHTTIRGDVAPGAREYAEQKIIRVARNAHRPVLFARLELQQEADRALERPSIAKVNLDVSGKRLRAHVAAPTMTLAADQLEARLRRAFEVLRERYEAHHHDTGIPAPGQWRHGALPAQRPRHFPRSPDDRMIVRQVTFGNGPVSPEEAVVDMELLHYDFLLFADAATGDSSVVYRRSDNTYGLMATGGDTVRPAPYADTIVLDPAPAPTLTTADAVERLEVGGEPFVFFTDARSGRGSLVYRRSDGHYGLLVPDEESNPATHERTGSSLP